MSPVLTIEPLSMVMSPVASAFRAAAPPPPLMMLSLWMVMLLPSAPRPSATGAPGDTDRVSDGLPDVFPGWIEPEFE